MMQSLPLQEHEPRPLPDERETENTYNPTEEERKLLVKVEALFQKAKKHRQKYDSAWVDYYKNFRGKQWKEQRPSYRASEVFNLIWQAIQTIIPTITDSKPKFEFLPQDPSDREFADLMNDLCESDWQTKSWLYTLTEVLYDSHNYGTGISTLVYNPKSQELEYSSVSPFYMFPDPQAESLKRKCLYVSHAEPEGVGHVKRMFPKYAALIKPDVVDFQDENRIDYSLQRYNSSTVDSLFVETSGYNQDQNEVLLKTTYMEDDEVLEEEFEDETGQKQTVRRLKYPDGRKVVVANEMILSDGPIGYEDDDCKYPYQRLINYIDPRKFWGISEQEPLESPQRTFNKLISCVLDVLYLTGNPVWVVDTTSGIDTDNLTNQPGLIVEKEPGSEVRREAGVQLQPYILPLIDRWKEWFESISNSGDIPRGIPDGGVTAAKAIEDLQNAANSKTRLKMRNLDSYLQDFGQQYVSRALQFYTAPKVYRVTGKDGANKYFKMHIDKVQDENGNSYHKANVQKYTENGLLDPFSKDIMLKGKLDVRVVTGSSLPFSKAENERRALNLFDREIIDAEEVLKRIEYPNYEAVLQRVNDAKARAAQAALAGAPAA